MKLVGYRCSLCSFHDDDALMVDEHRETFPHKDGKGKPLPSGAGHNIPVLETDADPPSIDHTRTRKLLGRIEARAEFLQRKAPHARSNWAAWLGIGYPGSSGGIRGSDVSVPTERHALRTAEQKGERDRFERDLAAFDAALVEADIAMKKAVRLAEVCTNVASGAGAIGCRACDLARRSGRRHPEAWQEVYANELCSFHDDFKKRYGCEAAMSITLYHLDHLGARIPHDLIQENHPLEFQRVHGKRRKAS